MNTEQANIINSAELNNADLDKYIIKLDKVMEIKDSVSISTKDSEFFEKENFDKNNINEASKFFQIYKDELDIPKKKEKGNTDHCKLIVKTVLPDWADFEMEKIEVKDVSGYGGSRTYLVHYPNNNDQESHLNENLKRVIIHIRNLKKEDPFTEERMADAQKALYNAGLAVPRIISAADNSWYIEPYYEQIEREDKELLNKEMAQLLAKIHKVSADWFESHREKVVKEHPILSEADKGSHIWLFTTRLEWYLEFGENKHYIQKAGFPPLSEYSKRIVLNHGDLHEGNKLSTKDGNFAIDYEFTAPAWAINDIAYCFSINQFGCKTSEGRYEFVKNY